jgi:alkylated DNA repair dioxygenase AlkB
MQSIDILETTSNEPKNRTDIYLRDMHLMFQPAFLSDERCDAIVRELEKLTFNSDQESQVFIGGQWIDVPRKQVAFSDENTRGYRFAGTKVGGRVWPEFLDQIRRELNDYLLEIDVLSISNNYRLNYCLVNLYRNGSDYLGYHRDAEADLQLLPYRTRDKKNIQEAVIVSLSFGATRDFLFQNIEAPAIKYKLPLKNGDLLVMRGETNKKWKHSVPKRLKVKESRYNLTFRIMKTV